MILTLGEKKGRTSVQFRHSKFLSTLFQFVLVSGFLALILAYFIPLWTLYLCALSTCPRAFHQEYRKILKGGPTM